MKSITLVQLANMIKHTWQHREGSYDKTTHTYSMGYHSACFHANVPEEIRPLITCLLTSGYCEVQEWVEAVLSGKL